MGVYNRVVVLGRDCRPQHHIQRLPCFRRYGSLRQSSRMFPRSVFSWQVTPAKALLHYLRNDFKGMYELDDLRQREDGVVVNIRYDTVHQHEFPFDPPTSIRLEYRRARARHDYLCKITRRAIADNLPTLFVFGEEIPDALRPEIVSNINRLRDGAPFTLVEWQEPSGPPTDPDHAWQGNHDFWRDKLTSFRIEDPASLPRLASYAAVDQLRRARKNLLKLSLDHYSG